MPQTPLDELTTLPRVPSRILLGTIRVPPNNFIGGDGIAIVPPNNSTRPPQSENEIFALGREGYVL